MFSSKTVFIIGAGASKEAKLPTGVELMKSIQALLDFRFDIERGRVSGDELIHQSLQMYLGQKRTQNRSNSLYEAARIISRGLTAAISIDNFLDAHRDNLDIELCGKLAVVRAILAAERGSYLNKKIDRQMNLGLVQDTWYPSLFRLLHQDVSKADIAEIFSNTTFIIFNYDRCVEHYLVAALCTYYSLDEDRAAQLVRSATIIHPYGAVGKLPWQDPKSQVPFGFEPNPDQLLKISQQIRTFMEQSQDEAEETRIRDAMTNAETIIFLGFAFHEMNMKIIDPKGMTRVSRVFATAKGLSDEDCDTVRNDIDGLVGNTLGDKLKIDITSGVECADLFKRYWRTLSRA